MKTFLFFACLALVSASCQQPGAVEQPVAAHIKLGAIADDYYEKRLRFFPVEATQNGDNRYNDLLPIEFTDRYRDSLRSFYEGIRDQLTTIERKDLNEEDGLTYDVLMREMNISLEGLKFHSEGNVIIFPAVDRIPFTQFSSIPLLIGQMGSGTGTQPFKSVADYDRWLKRAAAFKPWADSSLAYFRKGIAANYVLPKTLVSKIIDEMQAMVVKIPDSSLFYGPVRLMPDSFPEADKKRLAAAFTELIRGQLVPAYRELAEFFRNEYLPKARTTSGWGELPDGEAYYRYLVRFYTTTNKTPEEIQQIGFAEVTRIRTEMEKVKTATGFTGTLPAFFGYMKTNKQFMPYKKPQEILDAYAAIQQKIDPNLKKMFGKTPRTKFEIRQTEAFRAASASAEYFPGAPDGSRPGIFYVPVLDATTFNTTSGMESLFLHEAIPGHHYQGSLTSEDESLPRFRRVLWYGAYGEGWALYCESLGKELGLYTDPYQYMGALGQEIHRAIRLVVDVGIHAKKMTREEAIRYMMDNEPISETGAIAEVERYMATPGQALGYKIGAMKIRELRTKYEKLLGDKFNLAGFHDEFLKGGCLPLDIAESKMDRWAEKQH